VIEKIEQPEQPGKKPVILLQRGLEVREAGEGDEVRPTERVRTDATTSVTLKYVDGSSIKVGPGSDLQVEKSKKGVQSTLLAAGYVHGEVQRKPPSPSGAKPKIRFLVRTKAAVMGVRGTQFVAAIDAVQGVAEFHTLEGTVEVAKSAEALTGVTGAAGSAGGGTPVAAGQFVAASAESGITGVQSFNAASFMGSLQSTAGLQTVAASASAASSAAGAASTASSAVAAARAMAPSSSSPPPAPPPALASPPAPPKSPEQEAKEKLVQEEEDKLSPRFHPLNFQVGFVYAEEPSVPGQDKVRHRALQLAFTPYFPLPIPYLKWIYFRGFIGGALWEDGSLYNGVLTREAQLFAGVTLLRPLFAEIGGGIQNWAKIGRDATQISLNAGLVLNENKFFNRLFVGVTGAHFGSNSGSLVNEQWIGEVRAGLGFQF
jgi:hypothetical protein